MAMSSFELGHLRSEFWRVGWGVAVALILLLIVAWIPRGLALDVGQPGDRLFVRNTHGDERTADYSYRWTRAASQVVVPGFAGTERIRLNIRADSGRRPAEEIPVRIAIDGRVAGELPVGLIKSYSLDVSRPNSYLDSVTVDIQSATFRPPDDARDLGIILDAVAIEPLVTNAAPIDRIDRWLRLITLTGLVAMIILPMRRRLTPALGLLVASLLVGLAALVGQAWLLAGWGWLVTALGLTAMAANSSRFLDLLTWLIDLLDTVGIARVVLGLMVVFYLMIMVPLAFRIEHIGHADYADNAVVARNLVQGRGLSVDYVAQFYRDYPRTIRHPSDVWPLLQPLLIALAFSFFGISTSIAKLPNLLAMVGLIITTGWLGQRLGGPLVGLGAAALLILDDWYFENALFPVNDVPFALLAMLVIILVERTAELESALEPSPAPRARFWWSTPRARLYLGLGLASGLLVVAKPSGLLILIGSLGWWYWLRREGGPIAWFGWRVPLLAALVAGLVISPVVLRNVLTFGQPFYSLQSFDAWVTKWEPPDENIYRLWQANPPRPARLIAFGVDRLSEAVGLQFRKWFQDLQSGTLIELPLLTMAALAVVGGGAVARRQVAGLFWAALPYVLFIMIYWHYENRYMAWLVPWVAVLAMLTVGSLIRTALSGTVGQRWTMVLVVTIGLLILLPARQQLIAQRIGPLTSTAGEVEISRWLVANTPADAVVMTRSPWEISWHSERLAVMIPLAPLEGILEIGRSYGVDYLLLDRIRDQRVRREALAPLYEGREMPGFSKVQEFRNSRNEVYAIIYRVADSGRRGP